MFEEYLVIKLFINKKINDELDVAMFIFKKQVSYFDAIYSNVWHIHRPWVNCMQIFPIVTYNKYHRNEYDFRLLFL